MNKHLFEILIHRNIFSRQLLRGHFAGKEDSLASIFDLFKQFVSVEKASRRDFGFKSIWSEATLRSISAKLNWSEALLRSISAKLNWSEASLRSISVKSNWSEASLRSISFKN